MKAISKKPGASGNPSEPRTPVRKKRGMTGAKSEQCLHNSHTSVPQRKASTPTTTYDRSLFSNSPDISCISNFETRGAVKKQHVGRPLQKENSKKLVSKQRAPMSTVCAVPHNNLEQELDLEYTRYLQEMFRLKLLERNATGLDSKITNLQSRIEEKKMILEQTTQRLKNIQFNKEIALLSSLKNPNYGKILESVNKTDYEKYLSNLNEKLEQTQNQLNVKHIMVQDGGSAQLSDVISETVLALEKLKTERDAETPEVLKEISQINKSTANIIASCKNELPHAESLMLNRKTLEISARPAAGNESF